MAEINHPDQYWAAAISFLETDADLLPFTIGPVGFQNYLPETLSFAESFNLANIKQIICHKGMIDRLPVDLLASGYGRSEAVFSNEVFVVFRHLDHADAHVRSFEGGLVEHLSSNRPATVQWPGKAPEPTGLLRQPRRGSTRGKRIVAALQSPTLLNVWSRSTHWGLQVAELGDHEGLQESTLLQVDRWDGTNADVSAVLVASPLHLQNAEKLFPEAAYIWVLHNGRPGLLPADLVDRIDGLIALSNRVIDLQRVNNPTLLTKPAWVIPPSYTAQNIFRWTPSKAWTMKSRPSTRDPYDTALTRQLLQLLKQRSIDHTIYGQDTEGGFLNGEAKVSLMAGCSCYFSPLPPWAGFGLAQHECFASGVPLAGLVWGDLREDMPSRYNGLVSTLDGVSEQIERLCTDETYARSLSECGLDYIVQARSERSMNEAVERFISEIG